MKKGKRSSSISKNDFNEIIIESDEKKKIDYGPLLINNNSKRNGSKRK